MLIDACPKCGEEGSPALCTDRSIANRFVRCENCGYETEKVRDAILHEGTRRIVRRWNKEIVAS